MMKACVRRWDAHALQVGGSWGGRLAAAQHLCGALVGLVNPGLVGIGLSEGREGGQNIQSLTVRRGILFILFLEF